MYSEAAASSEAWSLPLLLVWSRGAGRVSAEGGSGPGSGSGQGDSGVGLCPSSGAHGSSWVGRAGCQRLPGWGLGLSLEP